MATLLLQNAGAVIGSAFGPLGTMIGRAAGGLAGYAMDQRLFGQSRRIEGPRLEQARILASSEGTPIPRLYGRLRIGGQLIWATRFEEVRNTTTQGGGKGAPPTTTIDEYAYFGNFAVGICEGPVTAILRVWADGQELDLTRHDIRIHLGGEDQSPDPLIEAKQGTGKAPAFKGTAYAVFEGLALETFGNRIPQLSFEVVRSISALDREIRAITIIPGSTEFGYSPIARNGDNGAAVNRNNLVADTDWQASLDELTAVCPNLETVALVVTWFGTDLRAGECLIEPRVLQGGSAKPDWFVGGQSRAAANIVSLFEGKPAYGGTPDDNSVLAAIADLKVRGLKVVLYPFIMMDVPENNALPDPYGATAQDAYPWRGRITCYPAAGISGTADKTAEARLQVESFAGAAQPASFSTAGGTVTYTGPADWGYRRMVLHYASLAALAGGVDGFVIGSELRGLTTIRDDLDAFPFVDALCSLVADSRSVLGPETRLTYAADWSEYFGYHPPDSVGEIYFHLDKLWAHPEIDAIGIDNYMRLADWREGGDPGSAPGEGPHSQFDPGYLLANIAGGEGFYWYYSSASDRAAGIRTPITDGLGESWVWRYKDLRSWWENEHYDRPGGVRSATPTAWVPRSKPLWMTELGCPAITMGANEPNVFVDAKSAQSDIPHFSTGVRSDLAQYRFLHAHHDYWAKPENNPVSPVYGAPMVDADRLFLWAWDARPFPAFPSDEKLWSDGDNWHRGHWLNGRLGGCPVDELTEHVSADFGVTLEASSDGFLDGYLVPGNASARQALEPLASMFNITYREEADRRELLGKAYLQSAAIDASQLVELDDEPLSSSSRADDADLPVELIVDHAGVFSDYEAEQTASQRLEASGSRQDTLSLPAAIAAPEVAGAAEARLRDAWIGRQTMQIGLPHRFARLAAGDVVSFENVQDFGGHLAGEWQISSIEDGEHRRLSLRAIARFEELPQAASKSVSSRRVETEFARPDFLLMDLPLRPHSQAPVVHMALDAEPWARRYAVWSAPGQSGFRLRKSTSARAVKGALTAPLAPGPQGRWDRGTVMEVTLDHGTLASLPSEQVFNGANACAVRCANGEWEIILFSSAALQGDGRYVLQDLLRAQLGSDGAMKSGASAGADFVWLDAGIDHIELEPAETNLLLNWRAGPDSEPVASDKMAAIAHYHSSVAARPYSPAHLSARRLAGGDIHFNWIRRSRIDADDWEVPEIPLGEAGERYLVAILDTDQSVLRNTETALPNHTYSATQQIADFGQLPASITFEVSQLTETGRIGSTRQETVQL